MAKITFSNMIENLFELSDLKLTKVKKLKNHATYYRYVEKEYRELLKNISQIHNQELIITLDILKKIKSLFLYEIKDAKKIFYIVLSIKRIIDQQRFSLRDSMGKFDQLEAHARNYNASTNLENAKLLINKYQSFLDKEFNIQTVGILAIQIRNNANETRDQLNSLIDPNSIHQKHIETVEMEREYGDTSGFRKTIEKRKEEVQGLRNSNEAICEEAEQLSRQERRDAKELQIKIEKFEGINEKDTMIKDSYVESIRILARRKVKMAA
jgi:hypothetical protein